MPAAALRPDETERLALRREFDLLDTPAEPVFDRVVRLASRLQQVPKVAFSLIDAERQWCKSRVGIEAAETPDGRWISVNRALCELLGHTTDELQGRGFADVTHEDDRAGDAAQMDRLARGEIDFLRRQKRYLRRDGSPVWVKVDVRRKLDAAGRHEYDVAVIKDIHAQKLAEEEQAHLHTDLERRVEACTPEELIKAADHWMVEAKKSGRGCVLPLPSSS